jgi:hypothetical protein
LREGGNGGLSPGKGKIRSREREKEGVTRQDNIKKNLREMK